MSNATPLPINTDGFYLGRAVEHTVQVNKETGSCTLSMKIEVTRAYDEGEKAWEDISQHNHFVYGSFNLLGRGGVLGQTQQKTVNIIQELFNWYDGELETLQDMDISGIDIMVDCRTSPDNNGQDRMRAEWIRIPEDEPARGGMKRLPESELQAISNKHAAAFRAIARPRSQQPAQPALGDEPDVGIGF